MRLFGRVLSAALLALGLAAMLASCNTSQVLTPQADVGGGRRQSTRVTQADTDRMARSQAPETYNNAPYAQQSGGMPHPQSSLEAQAQALQSGAATSPASSGPPPQWGGQGDGQGGGQSPMAQQPAMQQSAPQQSGLQQPASQQSPPQQSAALPAASASGTVRFLPIIGAPVQAVTPLSRQLGAQARAAGLAIRPSTDASTEHILKGYFSAFSDGGKVTIIYVWDILDGTGARLHRMQGQESLPARGSDPWAAVPAPTMEAIAAKTIRDYVAWRQSRG